MSQSAPYFSVRVPLLPLVFAVLCLPLASCGESSFQQANGAPPVRKRDASDPFFEKGEIPQLRIDIPKKEEDKLRANNRAYVKCNLTENGETKYKDVAIKLKGAAGSFRGLDDRPALTLNMDKHEKGQTFHAMDKFHLNNSVQDESFVSELIVSELCRDAGLPAPRVSHARVWLNGRDLGFYVLKEGFDEKFLSRHYADSSGNFYDGGFVRDIDGEMEKDSGKGPDDFSDVKALVAACREEDPAKRAQLVAERLNVDQFLTFTALEMLTCHWDGYIGNRNNYKFYFSPPDNRAVFFLHGMDQMFGDPNFPIFNVPGPMVGNAVLRNAEWMGRYRERVKELQPLFAPEKLHRRIDEVHARIRQVLLAMGEDRARHNDDRVREFKDRVAQRYPKIAEQLRNGPPQPLAFKQGVAELKEWFPQPETADAKVEELTINNQKLLSIYVGPSNQCVASWRHKVLLGAGTYRLEGRARVTGVKALGDDKGGGAGLRLSGGTRENKLVGTTNWEKLSHEFQVAEEVREVVLVAELRSTAGKAWFDPATLRLVKLNK